MKPAIKREVIYRRGVVLRLDLEEREQLKRQAREAKLSLQQYMRLHLGLPLDERRRYRTEKGSHRAPVQLGHVLFRFDSYAQWVNKAASWFSTVRCGYVCVDSRGRICQRGIHFMRARDENAFPVYVHGVD